MQQTIKEKLLLYKVQSKKDPEAFAQLYDIYVGPIYRFVFFKLSNAEDAEDVTSEVFLKMWQYLSGEAGKDIRSFRHLAYRVARNCIIDRYRVRAARRECVLPDVSEAEESFSDRGRWAAELDAKENVRRVLSAVDKLKEEYQEIIVLRYIESFSIREIAGMLGKSQTGVRVTLHRAIRKLRSLAEGTI